MQPATNGANPAPGVAAVADTSRMPGALAASVVLALISLAGRHEIGQLIDDASINGTTYASNVLWNPLKVHRAAAALRAWNGTTGLDVHRWLIWFLGCEFAVSVALLAGLHGLHHRYRLDLRRWLPVVDTAWALHAVLVLVAIEAGGAWAWPLAVLTYAAWASTVACALKVVWVVRATTSLRSLVGRWWRALGVQRFQVGVVLLLAMLFVVPGPPILEQGVDVVRSWALGAHQWWSAVWGFGGFALLGAALWYLGGVRAAPQFVRPRATRWVKDRWSWRMLSLEFLISLCIGAVLVGAFLALRSTHLTRIDSHVAQMTLYVVLGVPALGFLVRGFDPPRVRRRDARIREREVRTTALLVARLVAVAVPAVLLMSVCRSMFAPMMLLPHRQIRCICWLVVCAAGAIGLFVGAMRLDRPTVKDAPTTTGVLAMLDPQMVGARRPGSERVEFATGDIPNWFVSLLPSVVVSGVSGVFVLWRPVATSRLLGLVGTVGLCLLLLTALVTVMLIVSQLVDPPYLFRLARIRRTPVLELVVLVALLATLFAKDTRLHDIRISQVTAAGTRETLDEAFEDWAARQTAKCVIDVPSGSVKAVTSADGTTATVRRVQPLVLVAAEGGGIRAAWWTVSSMSKLVSTECGANALFLASGVSGGAVGLGLMASQRTLADTSADTSAPSPLPAVAAVRRMAAQDGLSAGVIGLLGRDLIAGAFGLEINAGDVPDDVDPFPDRAGMIEYAWQRIIDGYDVAFPILPGGGTPTVPWKTVFNGTSVAHDCRVLVSDVQLVSSAAVNDCKAPGNEIPGAYDLLLHDDCYSAMSVSTASFLAARFPYVTPSAVVRSGCDGSFFDQVIDGGYAENTGIDTANAVLTQLMPRIRALNDASLTGGGTVIVPVVIYLHNTVAASINSGDAPKPSPESAIPVLNSGDAATLGASDRLLQQSALIAEQWVPDRFVAAPTDDGSARPADVLREVALGVLHAQAITVAPQRKPQMALPLGWSMSTATEGTLDAALDEYLRCTAKYAAAEDQRAKCPAEYAFDTLLSGWHTVMAYPS